MVFFDTDPIDSKFSTVNKRLKKSSTRKFGSQVNLQTQDFKASFEPEMGKMIWLS